MKDLKECPFCGGEAHYDHCAYGCANQNTKYVVNCGECCSSTSAPMHTKEFAAEAWNTRTSIPISKIEELITKECFSVPTHEFESTTVIDIEDLKQLIIEAKK